MDVADCQRLAHDGDPLSGLHRQPVIEHLRAGNIARAAPSPFSVILLDRIDQAPASLRESLASEIERGEIVVPSSHFSLRNCFIILTGSLPKKRADRIIGRTIGFFREDDADTEMPCRNAGIRQ